MDVSERLTKALMEAVRILPADAEALIRRAYETEYGEYGSIALKYILKNLDISASSPLPLCQDTGMFCVYIKVGRESGADIAALERLVNRACEKAAVDGWYRKSIVSDPLFERKNTRTNLPPMISYLLQDGSDTDIYVIMKGFGSENCSSIRMLRPTASPDEVVAAVTDMMKSAGGKPCPPVFLGVGIGGNLEKAAELSKLALLRPAGSRNPDERYAELEEQIMKEVNALDIGPGGLGGRNTCLSVAAEYLPTHIAGLPVALTVNCWAERKAHITITKEELCSID